MIRQGDIRWCDLPDPLGSGPGYRRPLIVVQDDAFNQSRIATAVCVVLTANLALLGAPGNVFLSADDSGLPRDSVANASQILTVDRRRIGERAGSVPPWILAELFQGIDIVLGRQREV